MNGARFVHDRLELAGWQVEIANAQTVKGLAPLACKTDRIDAWVLAELGRRDLVPAIWLPDPRVRAERERARWRLHLVGHRSSLKQRVHAVLLTHGKPCPVSDLFGVRGRQLLARLGLPEPRQATIEASLRLIDQLEREISECEREPRRLGADTTATCRCSAPCPGSAGCSPTRSPPSPATSTASRHRASPPATAASAPGSTNPESAICAAHSASGDRAISAGRSSRPPPTPAPTPATATATNN
jgi:Transposase